MAKAIKRTFADLPYRYNLLFVDDGSSDLTLHEVKSWLSRTIISAISPFPAILGTSAAIKAGL